MAENKKPLTVLERLEKHDESLRALQDNVDGAFGALRNSVQSAMELLEAVVHTIEGGPAKVEEMLKTKRTEREVARSEQEKKQVEALVAQGVLKVSESITNMSLLVGRIFDKAGAVTGTGRNQVEFASLNPDIKEKFLGQGVGFQYTTDTGEKFEVLEVYEIVPQGAPATMAPATPAAVEPPPAPVAAPEVPVAPEAVAPVAPDGSWAS